MARSGLETVEHFFESLEQGDPAAVAGCFAADARVWTPGDHWFSGIHTPDEVLRLSGMILGMFPDGLRFQTQGITAQDDRIAVEATSEGHHVSGRTYRNTYHMLFVVRDGAIVHLKEYMDTALAGAFLGHEAPPSA